MSTTIVFDAENIFSYPRAFTVYNRKYTGITCRIKKKKIPFGKK